MVGSSQWASSTTISTGFCVARLIIKLVRAAKLRALRIIGVMPSSSELSCGESAKSLARYGKHAAGSPPARSTWSSSLVMLCVNVSPFTIPTVARSSLIIGCSAVLCWKGEHTYRMVEPASAAMDCTNWVVKCDFPMPGSPVIKTV